MEAIENLWAKHALGDPEAREVLVVNYLPLVRYVAGQMRMSLPRHVDVEDLISYGSIGLIRAVDRFDVDHGAPFTAFAAQWIRGAILDEIRHQDWAPRRVRRNGREIGQAVEALNVRLQRDPSLEEISAEMNLAPEVVAQRVAEVTNASHYSLDVEQPSYTEGNEVATLGSFLPDDAFIEEQAAESEHASRIARAISRMDIQEQIILALYYFEDCTFSQIASLLAVTESRIFQLHSQAMRSLRLFVLV